MKVDERLISDLLRGIPAWKTQKVRGGRAIPFQKRSRKQEAVCVCDRNAPSLMHTFPKINSSAKQLPDSERTKPQLKPTKTVLSPTLPLMWRPPWGWKKSGESIFHWKDGSLGAKKTPKSMRKHVNWAVGLWLFFFFPVTVVAAAITFPKDILHMCYERKKLQSKIHVKVIWTG